MLTGFIPDYEGCVKWEVGGLCSGHGYCVDNINNTEIFIPFLPGTHCVCNPKWNGNGLFIDQGLSDCSLNVPTADAFWGLALAVNILCLIGVLIKIKQFVSLLIKDRDGIGCYELIQELSELAGMRVAVPSCLCLFFGILTEISALQGNYPGNTVYSTMMYAIMNACSNISQGYYATIILPMAVNLVSMSVSEQEKQRMLAISQASWKSSIPFLMLYTSCIITFAFLVTMRAQHIGIIIWSILPFVPLGFGGTRVATSSAIIANILEETRRSQQFNQEVERHDTSLRLRKLASQQKQAWVVMFMFFGLLLAWPWFRTRLVYPLPWFFLLDAAAQLGTVQIFAPSAQGLAKDNRLEIFMRIVRDPFANAAFKKFLKKEFSEENLNFWETVESYRSLVAESNSVTFPAVLGEDNAIITFAKKIYIDYISEQAVQQVNLSSEILNKLHHWYECINSTEQGVFQHAADIETLAFLFKDAQHEIFQLMRSDSLARFQNTKEFQQIALDWQRKEFVDSKLRTLSGQEKVNEHKDSKLGSKEVALDASTDVSGAGELAMLTHTYRLEDLPSHHRQAHPQPQETLKFFPVARVLQEAALGDLGDGRMEVEIEESKILINDDTPRHHPLETPKHTHTPGRPQNDTTPEHSHISNHTEPTPRSSPLSTPRLGALETPRHCGESSPVSHVVELEMQTPRKVDERIPSPSVMSQEEELEISLHMNVQ